MNDHNQHQTINQNTVKIIGFSILALLLAISLMTQKNSDKVFGIPIDKINKTDTINPN